ncbi:hypothetical protein CANARDRAFT_21658 [[Candida] arabinofermentans NRRL YB-2248]|uniref:Uncharacterized protein n=1 Tax=[Candida] arabinofermentans NRRL YB-2248 TaxID=983967 RepID=A0A1E4T4R1_9ASCO|nr:hypothetical protein CANARDRAFT_21658 [[Candida] arabinofermentans NRRL YB-2248]
MSESKPLITPDDQLSPASSPHILSEEAKSEAEVLELETEQYIHSQQKVTKIENGDSEESNMIQSIKPQVDKAMSHLSNYNTQHRASITSLPTIEISIADDTEVDKDPFGVFSFNSSDLTDAENEKSSFSESTDIMESGSNPSVSSSSIKINDEDTERLFSTSPVVLEEDITMEEKQPLTSPDTENLQHSKTPVIKKQVPGKLNQKNPTEIEDNNEDLFDILRAYSEMTTSEQELGRRLLLKQKFKRRLNTISFTSYIVSLIIIILNCVMFGIFYHNDHNSNFDKLNPLRGLLGYYKSILVSLSQRSVSQFANFLYLEASLGFITCNLNFTKDPTCIIIMNFLNLLSIIEISIQLSGVINTQLPLNLLDLSTKSISYYSVIPIGKLFGDYATDHITSSKSTITALAAVCLTFSILRSFIVFNYSFLVYKRMKYPEAHKPLKLSKRLKLEVVFSKKHIFLMVLIFVPIFYIQSIILNQTKDWLFGFQTFLVWFIFLLVIMNEYLIVKSKYWLNMIISVLYLVNFGIIIDNLVRSSNINEYETSGIFILTGVIALASLLVLAFMNVILLKRDIALKGSGDDSTTRQSSLRSSIGPNLFMKDDTSFTSAESETKSTQTQPSNATMLGKKNQSSRGDENPKPEKQKSYRYNYGTQLPNMYKAFL